jgi:predicted Rossmann-fold nucleotide-binding protein
VSQIGEEMLQSVFEAVATRGGGLVHGAAGNGYMGAFHRQWAAVIEEYGLSREFAPEFLVPLGLSKEFRKKEPYLDLWKNPPTGVYTCPEIPDLDLRWAVMNYPRMLLGAVVATGGLGTLKEVLDTMLARQLKAASFTPFSFKHYLVDELGWSKDDPRLENLDPLIFVLDEWVEQDSLFVPGTRVKGWYYGDFLAGLLMQLERGTISAGDLSRIRVIRVGSRSTEQEHNLLRYSHLLNVQYLSLEEIGPYVVDELRRVYEAKASLFEQLNQLRAA